MSRARRWTALSRSALLVGTTGTRIPASKLLAHAQVKKLETQVRIVSDNDTLSGVPRFDGTRIPVHDVADMVANGVAIKAILRAYPRLTETHIDRAVAYADQHVRPPDPHPFRGWRNKSESHKPSARGPSP